MTKFFAFLAALIASAAIAQTVTIPPTTITVPAQTVTVTIPAQTITVPGQTISVTPAPVIVVIPPPAPPVAAADTVYNNGVFAWPGDYDYAAVANYKDPACAEGGTLGLSIKTSAWGAWQPYAPGWNFDLTPYGKGGFLLFDLKPTVSGQVWSIFALKVGDKPITGPARLVSSYGAAPVAGKWATYKVPLADFMTDNGVQLFAIYKFDIQDKSGLASNSWCVNNVHFSAT